MKCAGWTTILVVASAVCAVWRGFVFSKLWGWFILGTFTDIQMTIPIAIGISTIAGFLTAKQDATKPERKMGLKESLIASIMFWLVWPLLCLIFGWVVQFWV